MIRILRKKLLSPIGFLLVLTLVFGLLMFTIQLFMINVKQGSLKITNMIEQERQTIVPEGQDLVEILRKYDLSWYKCYGILSSNLELDDLKQMKNSYLTELKQIESKRRNLIRTINKLQSQIEQSKLQLENYNKKNKLVKFKILSNLFEASQVDLDLKSKLNTIKTVNTIIDLDKIIEPVVWSEKQETCSIEACFNYTQCSFGHKLKVYIYNHSKLFSFMKNLDKKRLRRSMDLSNDFENSCLIVIFLVDLNEINYDYYHDLVDFILKIPYKNNILFVDLTGSISKHLLIDYLSKMSELNHKIIKTQINRALFAGSEFDSQLLLKFNLIPNDMSISYPRIDRFNHKFLVSYIGSDDARSNKTELLKQLANKTGQLINIHEKNIPNPCADLQNTDNILSNSRYFLLMSLKVDDMYCLTSALKHGTIPVIVNSAIKLPIDDLISWDDVIIYFPFSNINNLLPTLLQMDHSTIQSRKIKARNIYNSYFSSINNQFLTLYSAVLHRLSIPVPAAASYPSIEFNFTSIQILKNVSSTGKTNSKAQYDEKDSYLEYENLDGIDDEADTNEYEYLGKINQKPIDSEEFMNNFTQDNKYVWNKIYYPFNMFSSLPISIKTPNDNQISFINSDEFNQDREIKFSEYIQATNWTYGGGDGKFFNHYLGGNYKEEQFSIVIMTYKREKILMDLLEKYVKLPYLHTIIVVWNNLDFEPSNELKYRFNLYISSKRIRFVKSRKNSLNNRFLPYDLIKTDAVLNLDDDVNLRPDEIMLAFRVWRENREKIVGFPARYHTWNFTSNNYAYQSHLSCEYSMVLTGAAFYHRFYNYMYSQVMDERIRDKVDEYKNCEDIAFNMMVSHITRLPPLKVTCKYSFYCAECELLAREDTKNKELPVSLKAGHYLRRTQCIEYFIDVYGYNPLLYSQYRADSVLFKTRLPADKQKCFKLV